MYYLIFELKLHTSKRHNYKLLVGVTWMIHESQVEVTERYLFWVNDSLIQNLKYLLLIFLLSAPLASFTCVLQPSEMTTTVVKAQTIGGRELWLIHYNLTKDTVTRAI